MISVYDKRNKESEDHPAKKEIKCAMLIVGKVASNPDLRDYVKKIFNRDLSLQEVQKYRTELKYENRWNEDRRMRDKKVYGNRAINNEMIKI